MLDLAARRAWIFDLDGTLIDAVHDFDAIRRELGLPLDRPILEALDELPAAEAAPLRVALTAIERRLVDHARPRAGARRLLETLVAQGRQVGILTRNSEGSAHRTLVATGLHRLIAPADVVGRDRAAPKPSPAGVRLLLERWGATPDEGLLVGDYLLDLQAARAAGVLALHLPVKDDPRTAGLADLVLDDLQPLLDAVGAA